MKKITVKKAVVVAVFVIFLIFTLIRSQRPCVAASATKFYFETKTKQGADFKRIFGKSKIQVKYKDFKGLVTIKEGEKEYQYLVEGGSSEGQTMVRFTDMKREPLESYDYAYDLRNHTVKDEQMKYYPTYPQEFGLEEIIQFGLLDTYSATDGSDQLWLYWIGCYIGGFLLIVFRNPIAMLDAYIGDLFYKLEKPIKPRRWVITSLEVLGGVFMIVGVLGMLRYIF